MASSACLRKRFVKGVDCSLALLMMMSSGCSNIHCCFSYENKSESGSTFFILGVGLISLPAVHGNEDILVANSKSVGLTFSNQSGVQAGLGYMNNSIVSVPTHAQSITEIKTCPIDDKTINIQVLNKN